MGVGDGVGVGEGDGDGVGVGVGRGDTAGGLSRTSPPAPALNDCPGWIAPAPRAGELAPIWKFPAPAFTNCGSVPA